MKKHVIKLTEEERSGLESVVRKGRVPGYKIKRANCLLACDSGESGPGWTDERISESFGLSVRTLEALRKSAAAKGVLSALGRKKRQVGPRPFTFSGEEEARLIALVCSDPPEGRARWSLRLLADKVVALEIAGSVSHETVRQTLKKTNLNLGRR